MSARIKRRRAGPLTIAYRIAGEGPPLIMFHGAEGDHQIYDRVQDAFGPSLTAISFDQRDCGLTTYDEPAPYALLDVAEDAIRLLDSFGIARAHVLGNSIGGILAQITAANWPERVDRLILGFTWPGDEKLPDLHPEGIARRMEYAAMGEAGMRPMAELMSSPAYVAAHPEIIESLKGLTSPQSAEARARRQAAFMAPTAVDPGKIQAKTLLIGGGADQMVPAAVTRRLLGRVPHSRFELLPAAGHLAARQYPQELAHIVRDFLLN